MFVVSNNVIGKLSLPDDAVIRINAAWVKTEAELRSLVLHAFGRDVFLDYPQGRTKPPKPTILLDDVLMIADSCSNVKYFAISNVESPDEMRILRNRIKRVGVTIVPKIETPVGVLKVKEIALACETDIVMLDKEDLYTAVNRDSNLYEHLLETLRMVCRNEQIRVLELQGVIFYEK